MAAKKALDGTGKGGLFGGGGGGGGGGVGSGSGGGIIGR